MNGVWILILILSGSGKAIDHIEYQSYANCETAKREVKREISYITAVCTVK